MEKLSQVRASTFAEKEKLITMQPAIFKYINNIIMHIDLRKNEYGKSMENSNFDNLKVMEFTNFDKIAKKYISNLNRSIKYFSTLIKNFLLNYSELNSYIRELEYIKHGKKKNIKVIMDKIYDVGLMYSETIYYINNYIDTLNGGTFKISDFEIFNFIQTMSSSSYYNNLLEKNETEKSIKQINELNLKNITSEFSKFNPPSIETILNSIPNYQVNFPTRTDIINEQTIHQNSMNTNTTNEQIIPQNSMNTNTTNEQIIPQNSINTDINKQNIPQNQSRINIIDNQNIYQNPIPSTSKEFPQNNSQVENMEIDNENIMEEINRGLLNTGEIINNINPNIGIGI